jgi:hypothetical protein
MPETRQNVTPAASQHRPAREKGKAKDEEKDAAKSEEGRQ